MPQYTNPTFTAIMEEALLEPQSWQFPSTPAGRSQAVQLRYRFYDVRKRLRRKGVDRYDELEVTIQEAFLPEPGWIVTIGPAGGGVLRYLQSARKLSTQEVIGHFGDIISAHRKPDEQPLEITPWLEYKLNKVHMLNFLEGLCGWDRLESISGLVEMAQACGLTPELHACATSTPRAEEILAQCQATAGYQSPKGD